MTIVEAIIQALEDYGILLVFLFSIVHPLLENPWSFVTLGLAMTVLSPVIGYATIATGTMIGIVLLYGIAMLIQRKSNHYFLQKNTTKTALIWLKETAMWRHIIVIGMPSVPTYPIKIALPFTTMSFPRYFVTLCGSYVFLYVANSLIYFGVLGFITDHIPPLLGTVLLIIAALYIYFGRRLATMWRTKKEEVKQ
jgi:uncharacterized membrane protein YdjX (TVP38/TMEM64 family)